FHAHLERIGLKAAQAVVCRLEDADDLLFVMDAVHFGLADGQPYFAGYVAADWMSRAADWNTADRQFLQDWLVSPAARESRAEAIDYIRDRVLGEAGGRMPYPYRVQDGLGGGLEGSRIRQ
ncbi:MAG: hypothetical protein RBS28_06125, partial [Rhodocyclaceae bacterium]|nr:hypothetical protein [Rhodocyclaceae bacterium]